MENNSTNENFEHFLRQSSEEFKMHPSSKVWDNISGNLNKRRRKYYFGFLSIIATSALVSYTFFFSTLLEGKKRTAQLPGLSVTSRSNNKIIKVDEDLSIKKLSVENREETNSTAADNTNSITDSDKKTTAIVRQLPVVSSSKSKGLPAAVNSEPDVATSDKDIRGKWSAELFNNNSVTRSLLNLNSPGHQFKLAAELSNPPATASVLNKIKRERKLGFMFFFTPTISYRKLSENKSYLRSPSPLGVPYNYSALYDINNAVTHKPDMGLEFGVTTKYTISKNVKLRGGIQFNINRYDIKAFNYVPEVATIALNNGRGIDSLNTMSTYRNFNGGRTDWLQNFYFQIAAPIGAEIKIRGNDKTYFGIASTIQPTYILGDRAYMITADYKNYAQVPWLIRRWNVNTNLETFVAYSSGKIKWQVGPQVRYQLLSSFIEEYPVKENLFDFGLKVGISLNQKDRSR
ncbi:MAG TPA: hypothetical protein VM935_09785 [Chitinophagaceae bacterium]|nr:hypothetical protein [Chitinophagaceae bacterium]